MNNNVFVDFIFVVVGVGLMFVPLDKRRTRASWANRVIVYTGLFTLLKAFICLSLDSHWIAPDHQMFYFIDTKLRLMFNGFYIGVIFALILSGQLHGTKRIEEQTKNEPAA